MDCVYNSTCHYEWLVTFHDDLEGTKKLQQFLGIFNYDRHFFSYLSKFTQPSCNKLKKMVESILVVKIGRQSKN